MLKNKMKFVAILLAFILLFSSTFVFAENDSTDSDVMPISEDSNINSADENTLTDDNTSENANTNNTNSYKDHDVYLSGNDVSIDYIIDGNLFVMADNVTINSEIGGDVFVIAKNLTINEDAFIYYNLFAISDSITIKGAISDVYALSNNFTLSKGYIGRDLKVSGGTLNINGAIGRNAFVSCDSLNFNTDGSDNAIIYGNLNYNSDKEFTIPENVVQGDTKYSSSALLSNISTQTIVANCILDLGRFLAFLLIVWLLCLWLAPNFLKKSVDSVKKSPLKTFGLGALTLILVPVISMLLLVLQLTSIFALLLILLYIVALILAQALFIITLNNLICSKLKINKNLGILGTLILVGIIIWLLTQIPYAGFVISIITSILGLGILVSSIHSKKETSPVEAK